MKEDTNFFENPAILQSDNEFNSSDVDFDDIEAAIPASTMQLDATTKTVIESVARRSHSSTSEDNDKVLMPPPSIPLRTQVRFVANISHPFFLLLPRI